MATEDVDDYHEQLVEKCADIEHAIANLGTNPDMTLEEEIGEVKQDLKWAKQLMMSYRVELRDLTTVQQATYRQKTKAHTQRLQQLQVDLNMAVKEAKRQALLPAAGEEGVELGTRETLSQAEALQGQSQASVARSRAMVEDTIEVAASTATTLQGQTEQLGRIHAGVEEVESNMKRADRQLRIFARRMMTDKIILCLIFCIVVAFIMVIIYSSIKGRNDKETSAPDEFKPQ
ncbi:Qb-SNARE [Thecamonas trahens ATCC 50062]|uniref:Qb-SNARE n=1 Tax=Thecamonas trahens ATCC 50062 TaxID=461836 RepID=A0A0L0DDB3_THETB|nr:Qb-SNARE [Thecamonas trahens ATCC 50062]KNC50342.1 Qb-SNARE [Thecamonas trahens ATCC 50062]|eukprot:XP_013756888.1 Qb-SNARE [Thecamonas trahens ATCC 50062]